MSTWESEVTMKLSRGGTKSRRARKVHRLGLALLALGVAGPVVAPPGVPGGVVAGPAPLSAQEAAQQDAEETGEVRNRPEADPADVASIDAIIEALYDVISGPEGEARDWDRFRSLMYPGAVLLPNFPEQGEGPRPLSVEEFVEFARQVIREEGFFERESHRTVQRYGPVANVFSTYESRRAPEEDPFVRGINSIQLVHDGDRWWVAHSAWTDVREAGPIPERYGGGG